MSPSRNRPHAVAAILLAVVLAGCASAGPPGYYTLAPIPPATAPPPTTTGASALIALGPVTLADYLDRRPIVTRDTAYALRLANNDYWAAPLHDMVPRVLVADLAMRLPNNRIESFPEILRQRG